MATSCFCFYVIFLYAIFFGVFIFLSCFTFWFTFPLGVFSSDRFVSLGFFYLLFSLFVFPVLLFYFFSSLFSRGPPHFISRFFFPTSHCLLFTFSTCTLLFLSFTFAYSLPFVSFLYLFFRSSVFIDIPFSFFCFFAYAVFFFCFLLFFLLWSLFAVFFSTFFLLCLLFSRCRSISFRPAVTSFSL